MPTAPIKISRLRDIGWSMWDPIGLLATGEPWEHKPFADEYDRYLIEAASRLRRDRNIEAATEFLMSIEREHMDLGTKATSRTRAEAAAKAIRAYLDTLEAPR